MQAFPVLDLIRIKICTNEESSVYICNNLHKMLQIHAKDCVNSNNIASYRMCMRIVQNIFKYSKSVDIYLAWNSEQLDAFFTILENGIHICEYIHI